jgi:integrase
MSLSKIKLYRNKIVIYYKKGDSFLRYDTGVRINNKTDFSERNGGVKERVNKSDEINKRIRNLHKKIETIIENRIDNPSLIINHKYIQSELLKSTKHKGDKLLSYYQGFFDLKKKEFSGDTKSLASLKDYTSLKNALLGFQDQLNKPILVKDVDYNLSLSLTSFLRKKRKQGKRTCGGLNPNTLKKRMILYYSFLRYVSEITEYQFPPKTFEVELSTIKPYIEILTKEEVLFLKDYELTDKIEEKVRDIFIFSCMTGLRWSDLITLNKTQVYQSKETYYIKKENVKTNKEIIVPLNSTSYEILKKYNYNLKYLTNQQFNRILKEIVEKTGRFNRKVDKINKDTGKKHKRWELISIHKGRHTFISNLIKSRVSLLPTPSCKQPPGSIALLHGK